MACHKCKRNYNLHVRNHSNRDPRTSQNPDDVVITLAIRTPLCKGGKGGLKDTPLDGILYKLLCEVNKRSRIDPQMVEDICIGNVRTFIFLLAILLLT